MATGVTQLLSAYESRLTRIEIVDLLVEYGAGTTPADIAPDLPTAWLDDLRLICRRFPEGAPPGSYIRVKSVCEGPDGDDEVSQRSTEEADHNWRTGLLAWQHYFAMATAAK